MNRDFCRYVVEHETELMTSRLCHIHPAFMSYMQYIIVYVKFRSHVTYCPCPFLEIFFEKYHQFHPLHDCTNYLK